MQIIQRLRDLLHEMPGAALTDYLELEARGYTYIVSLDTAMRVRRELDQFPQPEWTEFTDLFGARQCIRSQDVFRISESTPQTRARMRAFLRAREKEEKAQDQLVGA